MATIKTHTAWKKNFMKIKELNETIARRITLAVSTMWCVYAFAIMVLIPLFVPAAQMVIMYISSSFLQLILLPLIMVGQDVLSRKSEQRAEADHAMLIQELAELKDMHHDLHDLITKKKR